MMLAPLVATLPGAVMRGMEEHRRNSPQVFYITGGRPQLPPVRSAPWPTYTPQPSQDNSIGLGTLILGGLLFGGL